jgi:hypothetical protein
MSDLAISALASTDLDKPRRRRAAGAAVPIAQNQTSKTSNFPRKPTNSPESAVDAPDCAPSHPKQDSVVVAFYRIYSVERHVH